MRTIKPNQIDYTPLQIGMTARGLSEPIVEFWNIQNGKFYNKHKDLTLSEKAYGNYSTACAWDGIMCVLICLPENK